MAHMSVVYLSNVIIVTYSRYTRFGNSIICFISIGLIFIYKQPINNRAVIASTLLKGQFLKDVAIFFWFVLLFFCSGREYMIPSPLQRFFAEMVDFFILFFIKATIILSVMHLSGIK